ncbi:uncharacterized protein LOC143430479 [Xylocopa sonorina]|uniref:uncharacterized protein LOC143430479 n=1 Tax=Xylocopa sonorina TaxID=1818115 RepID=UPI00403B02AA
MQLGIHLTFYADDTLVLAIETSRKRAICRAEIAVAAVAKKMEELGLQMVPEKTEILCFEGKRRDPYGGNEMVAIGPAQAVRLDAAANYLSRIMPNMNGTDEKKPATPAKCVEKNRDPRRERISHDILRRGNAVSGPRAPGIPGVAPGFTFAKRKEKLAPASAHRTVGAILPILEKWMEERRGQLTFRATQVLTGPGCFAQYLQKIGKEATAVCFLCGEEEDRTQHTLEFCPAWETSRHALVAEMGTDLLLNRIIPKMLENERYWRAVILFCDRIIAVKGHVRSLLNETYVVSVVNVCHAPLQGRGLFFLLDSESLQSTHRGVPRNGYVTLLGVSY